MNEIKATLDDEDSAISADFVVLTGLVITLAIFFVYPVLSGAESWGEALANLVYVFTDSGSG